jgi:very-short-patch-repair endonuclease
MTKHEQILWEHLRTNKLGLRFKAQHPIERFIVDFYCDKVKLVVEIDGGIHNQQKEYDLGRTAELEKYGITVIRFTNDEIESSILDVVEKIKNVISNIWLSTNLVAL